MTPVRTPFRTYTNDKGRTFAVRYLPEGARYGRTNALTTDRPTVEFYDTTHADDASGENGAGFGPLGQFTGARCYLDTLLGRDGYFSGKLDQDGLILDDGNRDVWSIDGATMRRVVAWLATLGNTWTDAEREEFAQAFISAAVTFLPDAEKAKLPDTACPVHQLGSNAREQLVARAGIVYDAAPSDLATWLRPGHAGWQLWKNGLPGATPVWGGLPTADDDGLVFSEYATRVLGGGRPAKHEYAEFMHATARLTVLARGLGTINGLVVDKRDDGLIHLADITH